MAKHPNPAALSATHVLSAHGVHYQGVEWNGSQLTYGRALGQAATITQLAESASYFVGTLPVEVHCHSIGSVDFSEFLTLDLTDLNAAAAAEGVLCIPTLYLRHDLLNGFVAFMHRYSGMRKRGLLPFVPGIALEGPLLASHGGTPSTTVWAPTRHEWASIAACGPLGLLYIVVSPDAFTPASGLYDGLTRTHPGLDWVITTLIESGVRPALGHYTKTDPWMSAELTAEAVEVAWSAETSLVGSRVLTDHLFNDMPLNIQHAFRTRRARATRSSVLESYGLPSWNLDDLHEQVGPVPATIMRLCSEGRVVSCINFDGDHVDLAIAARAVEIVGLGAIILMTDRCDAARLGGQQLTQSGENSLWYQDGGIVAAGSQPIDRQILNARNTGVDEDGIWSLVAFTAHEALGLDRGEPAGVGEAGCFMINLPGKAEAPDRWERITVQERIGSPRHG